MENIQFFFNSIELNSIEKPDPTLKSSSELPSQEAKIHNIGMDLFEDSSSQSIQSFFPKKERRAKKRKLDTITFIDREKKTKKRKCSKNSTSSNSLKENLTAQQIDFFKHQEPEKWYPFKQNEQGKIEIKLPLSLQTVKKLIYVFRNREKNCFLIGKTGGSLNKRISNYVSKFNEVGSENKVKKARSRAFLMDVKQDPDQFDVGILYALKPEEDLDFFENEFIKQKQTLYTLYNENSGGGGGCSHSEEKPTIYAIPKDNLFTPPKYYPYKENLGHIRPQFSPGFKQTIKLREGLEETQQWVYAIKNRETGQRYIGITSDPLTRAKKHAYDSEYYVPEHKKYNPSHKSGYLHPAIAKNPEKFGFGLFPLKKNEKSEEYVLLNSIAKVERYVIQLKQSHISEKGYNGNRGGGGPIAKRTCKRVLKF